MRRQRRVVGSVQIGPALLGPEFALVHIPERRIRSRTVCPERHVLRA